MATAPRRSRRSGPPPTEPAATPRATPDPADLAAFQALAASPIRSAMREAALADWQRHKLARQLAGGDHAGGDTGGKQGLWTKGGYIAALTRPAIDLRGAQLSDVCVGYADLRGVRFDGARFNLDQRQWSGFKGVQAEVSSWRGAWLPAARFLQADLRRADFSGAHLQGADFSGAQLAGARFVDADLRGACLTHANLVGADLRGADLSGARVYGASVWDAVVDDDRPGADPEAARVRQRDLVVTPDGQTEVTADRIEVAQFLYLLLSNPRIRDVIDTVSARAVLILGRFSGGRLALLQALRTALRARGWVPIVFDFTQPRSRDITETVKTLAGLSRFIISDISNPRSNPLELQATVPDYAVPMVPLLAKGEPPFAMFQDLWHKYPWVLEPLAYRDADQLLAVLDAAVIAPALQREAELAQRRARPMALRDADDFAAGSAAGKGADQPLAATVRRRPPSAP